MHLLLPEPPQFMTETGAKKKTTGLEASSFKPVVY
jgi:hypothetical protein